MEPPCNSPYASSPHTTAPVTIAERVANCNEQQFNQFLNECKGDDFRLRQLITATFQGNDQGKQKVLLDDPQLREKKLPLLAHSLHLLTQPLKWDSDHDCRFLLEMGDVLMKSNDPQTEPNLQALGRNLVTLEYDYFIRKGGMESYIHPHYVQYPPRLYQMSVEYDFFYREETAFYHQVVRHLYQIGSEELQSWCLMSMPCKDLNPYPSPKVWARCVNRVAATFPQLLRGPDTFPEPGDFPCLDLLNNPSASVMDYLAQLSEAALGTRGIWDYLARTFVPPLSQQQQSLFLSATRGLNAHAKRKLLNLSPAQIAQLTVEEYPKALQYYFIFISSRPTDTYQTFSQFVATLTPEEVKELGSIYQSLQAGETAIPYSPVWVRPEGHSLEPPMDQLFQTYLTLLQPNEVMRFPKPFLLAHASLIIRVDHWSALLNSCTDNEIGAIIPHLRDLIYCISDTSNFPFARIIRLTDDPLLLKELVPSALKNTAETCVRDTLEVLEEEPWKLYSSLWFLSSDINDVLNKEIVRSFPKCMATLNWYHESHVFLTHWSRPLEFETPVDVLHRSRQLYIARAATYKESTFFFIKDLNEYKDKFLNGKLVEEESRNLAKFLREISQGDYSLPPQVAKEIKSIEGFLTK